MKTQTDQELLRDYSTYGSEESFSTVYQRHLEWVHCAANRLLPNDLKSVAPDVTRAVFISLSQKASRFKDDRLVLTWLHDNTWCLTGKSMLAVRTLAQTGRGHAAAITAPLAQTSIWQRMEGQLDNALSLTTLPPLDREALLMRFFGRQSFAQIGDTLGFTEESTRERVYRSADCLRERLDEDAATLRTGAFMSLLWDNAVRAAPAGLAAGIAAVLTACRY